MNLFTTSNNPIEAAQHLDDTRLNKMCVESCQMLVMALVANGLSLDKVPLTKSGAPYKTKGHSKHPVTIWTGRTRSNFLWHLIYTKALVAEYHHRTSKTRAGMNVLDAADKHISLIPEGDLEEFYNSSMHPKTRVQDVVECYRKTMIDKWTADKIKVKWTKRKPPEWSTIPVVESNGVYYRLTEKEASEIEGLLVSQT